MKCDSEKLLGYLRSEIVLQDCYRLRRFKDLDLIVDIGANVGVFSRYARSRFPDARIIAFEPCPSTYAMLVENLEGYRVETHQVALGDGSPVGFRIARTSGSNQSFSEARGTPSASLEGLLDLAHAALGSRAFVKVDCEGAERYLTDHMSTSLLQFTQGFGMEYHLKAQGSAFPDAFTAQEFQHWVKELRMGFMNVEYQRVTKDRGNLWGIR